MRVSFNQRFDNILLLLVLDNISIHNSNACLIRITMVFESVQGGGL